MLFRLSQIQRSKIGVGSHINTELSAASGRMSSAYLKSAASSGVRVRKLSLPGNELFANQCSSGREQPTGDQKNTGSLLCLGVRFLEYKQNNSGFAPNKLIMMFCSHYWLADYCSSWSVHHISWLFHYDSLQFQKNPHEDHRWARQQLWSKN